MEVTTGPDGRLATAQEDLETRLLSVESGQLMPWRVAVDLLSVANGSAGTPTWTTDAGTWNNLKFYNADGANGNYFEWAIALAAGTWTIDVLHFTDPWSGIVTFSLDGTDVGTSNDWYTAGTVKNVRDTHAGIVVATSGTKVLRVRSNGKHASSGAYTVILIAIGLRRTA